MSLAVPHGDDTVRIYVKGASEVVLGLCSQAIFEGGEISALDAEEKERITDEVITPFAKKAYRTLTMAYKDVSRDEIEGRDFSDESEQEWAENELTLISIFGIIDPLRPEILQSMSDCRTASVNVRMVTGDNIDTARAISLNAGIILPLEDESQRHPYAVMEGRQFRELIGEDLVDETTKDGKKVKRPQNIEVFKEVAANLRVLARSTPNDKYLLVTGLRYLDKVVAVTGDGTNDAPALKKADVGFAMGITGTEVAKEAADIILLDDNFKSIITAMKWGRNIYQSVRKFLQF